MAKKRSTLSIRLDRMRRSKEPWERCKGAPKKGNPRYRPVMVRDKKGNMKKVYIVR